MKVEQFGKQDRSGGVPRISGRERRWAGSLPPRPGRTRILRSREGREWSALCRH
jgi:hypothetical protein